MVALSGAVGDLRFQIQVTRADTGKIETYELIGRIDQDQLEEICDGSDPFDGSAQCSD